jgi:uncharacterized membrane protein YeaQ/YmgE (transglycosylase-associated protein family)
MGIIAWVVLGLIAGLIARAIYPGEQPGGMLATILLGIVGAVIGGWIGHSFSGAPADYYTGLSFMGIVWSVVGSLVVLFFWGLATGSRRRVLP